MPTRVKWGLIVAATTIAFVVVPVTACMWDYDTIRDERRGLPGMAEILSGRYERHSKYFYEQRVIRMQSLLQREPRNLGA